MGFASCLGGFWAIYVLLIAQAIGTDRFSGLAGLVGTRQGFGMAGPVYEIVGAGGDLPNGDVTMEEEIVSKKSVRKRADEIKAFRCINLIAVIENPTDIKNIGTVIRNVNALGVEKVYVVDARRSLPDDWQDLRTQKAIAKTSVSAVKWTFVKRFDSTEACFDYLEAKNFQSIVTSPHVKGKKSIFLDEGDYTVYPKLAVWFGSEAIGISDVAIERSEMCVSIPMFGMIESLNLGTSSGIVLYEVAKQRRAYQSMFKWRNRRGERPDPLPTVMMPDG